MNGKTAVFVLFGLCVLNISAELVPEKSEKDPEDPCDPSPCGYYATCKVRDANATCSCWQGFLGSPPDCRPECTVNSDCENPSLACINRRCRDPCPEICAPSAKCTIVRREAICSCRPGYTGHPFFECTMLP